ncbi:peptidylprolyl isomerase [Maribellus sediminis]|uniref:peptidylprolyl isomerase n=1 Tax=Maribellus sediminis TaxID=2696285 RepID=UPI001431DFD1|nr:peptidylprolyl isomerase [Maribellus sediminis]
MKKVILFSWLLIVFVQLSFAGQLPKVLMTTSLGKIVLEIDTVRAPVTAKNFLMHVKNGTYKDAVFYRVVRPDNQPNNAIKIEVIQGGVYDDKLIDQIPTIAHETTEMTGIKHKDGTFSMARYTPGTACSEFFICVGDQPELDFGGKRNPDGQGFAAFGQVVKGMKVVRKIQQQKDKAQYLLAPVKIESIGILK